MEIFGVATDNAGATGFKPTKEIITKRFSPAA
jgi:hypothetical protein